MTTQDTYDIILFADAESVSEICWCGSMAEQLICNQQVVGSTPITSSKEALCILCAGLYNWERSRVAKGGRL